MPKMKFTTDAGEAFKDKFKMQGERNLHFSNDSDYTIDTHSN